MVIIAYDGKTDEEFLNSFLSAYKLPEVTYYKYELTDKWAYNTFYKQKKYPFDFNHSNFDELKQKLQNLFN